MLNNFLIMLNNYYCQSNKKIETSIRLTKEITDTPLLVADKTIRALSI